MLLIALSIALVLTIARHRLLLRLRRSNSWDDIRYFRPEEFDSRDADGSGVGTGRTQMSLDFVTLLDGVRHALQRPVVINSGYRTPSHNLAVGGVPHSTHIGGLAADIHCPDRRYMDSLVAALESAGAVRIGRYRSDSGNLFVHCDISLSRPQRSWNMIDGRYATNEQFNAYYA